MTDVDLGEVGILYQIQSLQKHAVFLAGYHELRTRNQFFCLALTKISYQQTLSHSRKCWMLLGIILMGWIPAELKRKKERLGTISINHSMTCGTEIECVVKLI